MARGARRWFIVATVLALAACDQPNDWPQPPRGGAVEPVVRVSVPRLAEGGCADPLVGLWLARRYDGVKWFEHRVSIERLGGALRCRQESRSWPGMAGDTAPPRCPAGGFSYHQVQLGCELTERPPVLELRSLGIILERHTCDLEIPGYNLDHFSGTLAGNTWETVNNDGGDDVDKPYRFHRVSCAP